VLNGWRGVRMMNKEETRIVSKEALYRALRESDKHHLDHDFKIFGAKCKHCGIKGSHADDCIVVNAIGRVRGW
jgi:hypothetical protein